MNKAVKTILIVFVALILLVGSFSGGFLTAQFLPLTSLSGQPVAQPPVVSSSSPDGQTGTPQELQTLFQPFWETWTLVHQNYVDQPVDDVALMRGAINGMLATLTVGRNYYLDPQQLEENNTQLNGQDYSGIGAFVDLNGDFLTISRPIKGSPAEKAGLLSGDQVIAIDGVDMTGVPPEDARQKVLGPADTDVTLTILRKGVDKPFDVKITRAKIVTPLLDYEMRPDGIAYVHLWSFGDTADVELKKALTEMLAQNPKGLIIDLRFNGGGYLDQGIAVASEFLPKDKVVVYEKFGDGKLTSHMSFGKGAATDIPMVVLVNEYTASASEIVAGALQDYDRAKLIGTLTYGKGSVQLPTVLQNNQGEVAITIASWLTPNKRYIDKISLTPDIFVSITQADFDANRDPQLDAAVETLLSMLAGTPLPTSMPTPVPTP